MKDRWGRDIDGPMFYVEVRSKYWVESREKTHRFVNAYNKHVKVGSEAECEKHMMVALAKHAREHGDEV